MKEIDILIRLKSFDDTMEVIKKLKDLGLIDQAKHLHELWTLAKQLGTEVRRLRK